MPGMPSITELDNADDSPKSDLHLAMQAHQSGDLLRARELYHKAEQVAATSTAAKLYLGAICLQERDYDSACSYFRQIEGTSSDGPMLQINFGMALMESGQLQEALSHLQKGVDEDAASTDARFNLARCLQAMGKTSEAAEHYEIILRTSDKDGQVWCLYGGCLALCGKASQALQALQQAFKISGESALLRFYSGQAWEGVREYTEAAANYSRSLELEPSDLRCVLGMARVLPRLGQFDQALQYCQQAEQQLPHDVAVLTTCSAVYLLRGDYQSGISYARKALEVDSECADACGLLAYGLGKNGQSADAEEWYAKAESLDPHNPQHPLNRSANHAARGMAHLAMESAYRALELAPQNPAAFSNVLLYLHYPDNASQEDIFSLHCKWGQLFAQPPQESATVIQKNNPRRIGFLSGDLRRHSVAFFIRPLLQELHKQNIECYIYSNNPSNDSITDDLKTMCSGWFDIRHVDDNSAYELIESHNISVLIELNGHTDNNRLQLFSRLPAQVCASWLGYPDTTGINGTYRITDSVADPEGEEEFYTETLLRLPECFLCFEAPEMDLPIVQRTVDKPVTFGSFNNISKISDKCAEVWAKILQEVPQSTLMLKSRGLDDSQACCRLLDLFSRFGISAERITLQPAILKYSDHMQAYNTIDIALDTFPYNGTTTTCEALWMGRPVITMAGEHHRSRVGASLLHACGMENLIAHTAEDYVHIAAGLVKSTDIPDEFHNRLREKMRSSRLCNAKQFASDFTGVINLICNEKSADSPV